MNKMDTINKLFQKTITLSKRLDYINEIDLTMLNGKNRDSNYLIYLQQLKRKTMICEDNELEKIQKLIQKINNEN